MSMPPPPSNPQGPWSPQGPQGQPGPQGFPPQPGYQPPGYQPYGGMQQVPPTKSGMAIASLVLSLVGLIPCFWLIQVPGLLGMIFGFVGLGQTKDNARPGRGMAVAGLIIGILLLVGCVAFWIYFATNANCYRDGTTWRCIAD